ncbi:hypothetical protein [Nocardioides pakistanensis]
MNDTDCAARCGRTASTPSGFCTDCWDHVPSGLRHAVTVTRRALARQPLNGPLRDYHEQMVRAALVAIARGASRHDACCADGEYCAYHAQPCHNPSRLTVHR